MPKIRIEQRPLPIYKPRDLIIEINNTDEELYLRDIIQKALADTDYTVEEEDFLRAVLEIIVHGGKK